MALKLKLEVTGHQAMSRRMLKLAALAPSSAAIALNEVAEETMTDSKEHTPVEFGVLKGSGHVFQHATPARMEAKLAYGTEYAIYVHERTELRHEVGEAKFLENALNRTSSTIAKRITSKMRAIMAGGL